MTTLPQELVTEILSLLPIKPLVRFQCVSKPWFYQINNSDFIKLHLNHSREHIILFETSGEIYMVNYSNDCRFGEAVNIKVPLSLEFRIAGYCNGLYCLTYFNCDEIVIWNPVIGKYKKLPSKPPLEEMCGNGLAFGYDQVNDDYKVFNYVTRAGLDAKGYKVVSSCETYSLRKHSWRMVEEEWPFEESYIYKYTALNSTFHWLVCQTNSEEVIVAFNLSSEKFQVLNLNFLFMKPRPALDVVRGLLCLIMGMEVTEFWVMKEYGVANSWTLLYTVQPLGPCVYIRRPSIFLSHDSEEVLITQRLRDDDDHEFYPFYEHHFWYDIKNKTRRIFEIQNMPHGLYTLFASVGSLLLLDVDCDN
jgi:F-box interacting protein